MTALNIPNPLNTDGFEFAEYASPNPQELDTLFKSLGFTAIAKHKSKDVTLYRQGDINFVLNNEPNSQASHAAEKHGPCVCAMGFRVKDAKFAWEEAQKKGAEAFTVPHNEGEEELLAIKGIGESIIYFVDKYGDNGDVYGDFIPLEGVDQHPKGMGLTYLDHLTHNVYQGNMDKWAKFYEDIFNFKEIRYFDIEGKLTGLVSKAMTSPCGKIRIPINEDQGDKGQIAEFLNQYNGEGIQHIAMGTNNIYTTVETMREHGTKFLTTPDTYYEKVDTRVPNHGEDLERMHKNQILVDGAPTEGQGLLLQIFTEVAIGPVFFEIIQRKGNEGFGEGNFQALFESIEEDQIRRGVLETAV
jgi:4-hydroxyphenylpyruvate dioxygenase